MAYEATTFENSAYMNMSTWPTSDNVADSSYTPPPKTDTFSKAGTYDNVDDGRSPEEISNFEFLNDATSDGSNYDNQKQTNNKSDLFVDEKKSDDGKSKYGMDSGYANTDYGLDSKMGSGALSFPQNEMTYSENAFQRSYKTENDFGGDYQDNLTLTERRCNWKLIVTISVLVCLLLVAIATPLIIVFVRGPEDTTTTTSVATTSSAQKDEATTTPSATHDRVVVDMALALNQTFTEGLSNTSSEEYKNFTKEFCNEISGAFQTSTYTDKTATCQVTNITEGSIIVAFTVHVTGTIVVTDDAAFVSQVVDSTTTVSDTESQLGSFLVIISTIIVVGKPVYIKDAPASVTSQSLSTTTDISSSSSTPTAAVTFLRESQTFNMASRANMSCIATSTHHWTSLEIWKTTDGNDVMVLRKYKSGSPADDEPLKTRVDYIYEFTDTSLSVTLRYNSLACNDNGTYRCVVNTTSTSVSATSSVSVIRYPSVPILTLHPDQIIDMGFHREGFENECRGEVGYPYGSLTVVYKQKNQSEFVAFPDTKVIYYLNATEGDCSKVQSLKFGLNFTDADQGAEIKCVTRNDHLDIIKESVAQSLELIPRNYCVGATERYRYHPINCNKFIDCDNKDYPAGGQCLETDQCITDITNAVCGDCNFVTCANNASLTTTTAVPETTMTPPPDSLYITTTDASVFLGESVVLMFNVSKSQFDYLNLTSTPSETGVKTNVVDVLDDGSVIVYHANSQLYVSYVSNIVTININKTECFDDGKYEATVRSKNESFTAAATLTLKAKPETPTLNLHPDLVETSPRLGVEHTCTGNVGYPGGKLKIEISMKSDVNNYSVPIYLGSGSVTNSDPVRENCTNKATFKFLLNLGMEWNGGMIKCTAENENVVFGSDEPPYVTERMDIIEQNYCTNETDNTYKPVLNTCNKYAQCAGEFPYGKTCGDQCYDSSKNIGLPCSDCGSVYCSANPTTTTTPGTTTPLPDANSLCTGSIGYVGSTVNFTCTVNGDFTSVNITKGSDVHLADVIPTTGVVLDDTGDRITVSYDSSMKELEVTFTNLNCTDDGTYSIRTNGEGSTHLTKANIQVYSKVDEKPQLRVPVKIVEDQLATFDCSGETGLPASDIYLEIKRPTDGDYKNMSDIITVTTTKNVNQASCNTRTDFTFTATMSMSLNDSSIRCVTKQEDSADQVSDLGVLQVVSKDICSEYNSTVTAVKYHPYTCGKWITCHHGSILMNECGTTAPCVQITSSSPNCLTTCDHCN